MTSDFVFSSLVVDDDPAIRQSMRLCLEAEGARVQQAATAAGCLDALDRSRLDVVFLDLWLGAAGYLPKPFTPAQVRAAARRVVTAGSSSISATGKAPVYKTTQAAA